MTDLKTGTILSGRPGSGAHRVVALCGPYLSGKTSLLESLLYATGAIGRRGSTRAGTSIGDGSARGAQAQHGHRDQHRVGRLSRRPMDLPRRAGLDRIPARLACGARGVRHRRHRLRALARARGRALAAREIHRGQPHPAPLLHQQDQLGRRPRARHAGGAADRLVAQARAAPGADPPADRRRRRGDDRLCRPRERARLPLPVERRVRPDRDAGRDPAARERGAARDARNPVGVRRHPARAADRGCRAGEVADLSRPARRVRRRQDLAGAARRGRSRERRSASAEGAAPRRSVRRARPPSGATCRPTASPMAECFKVLHQGPCRQAVALPHLVGQR